MLKSIRIMFDVFETEDIEYCHFKSNEHLKESSLGDTDLDIIFNPEQRDKIEIVLNQCGLKRFRTTPHMQYNAVEDYIGFDKETAKIWHLHLHYRLTLGEKHLKGYTLPWNKHIINNSVFDEEFKLYRSSPEDECFLLLLRIALKLRWRDYVGKISKEDIAELNWLKEKINIQTVIETSKKMLGSEVTSEYEKLLKRDLIYNRDLYKLQKLLRSEMKSFTQFNLISSYFKRTVREILWAISGVSKRLNINSSIPKRRISPTGGTVIALLGSDGAGKTTTLSYINKEFRKKIDVKKVYLGSGDGNSSILRYPMKIVAKRIGGKGVGRSIKKDKELNKKSTIKIYTYSFLKILWAIALAQEKNKKLKKIIAARNNGILILVDRYPQTDVMGYNDGPLLSGYLNGRSRVLKRLANWEMSIYKSAYVNPPDLVLKLMVSPELAIKRKPEMTYSEVQSKIDAVKKIKLSEDSKVIDTSKSKEITYGQVMEEIWRKI